MKRVIKASALLLIIALLTVSLCSCGSLETAKANQAFYLDNNFKSEIILRDTIYRKIYLGNLSFIDAGNYGLRENGCYVTEKGVPVLLSSWYGDRYSINKDESVLSIYGEYYVREDKYEAVKDAADSAVLDHYYISYYPDSYYSGRYDDIASKRYDTDTVSNILLEQDVTDAINKALATGDSDKVQLTQDQLYTVEALKIERCDKDMMVTMYDNNLVLLRDGESFYVSGDNDYWADSYSVYPIEKNSAELIKELFEKYPEAVDQTAF
jgi:hypothetical protein